MLTCSLLCRGKGFRSFETVHFAAILEVVHARQVSKIKKQQHFVLSQNFISTCRYLDDHCQFSSLFSYIKIYWQRRSTEVLQGKELNQSDDDKQRNTAMWTTTTSPSFPWDLGARSNSSVNSMRRSVTGQMQEPEDDVTGVAAFQLAGLVVSFVLDEAGLVRGAAFCARVLMGKKKRKKIKGSYY